MLDQHKKLLSLERR